MRHKNNKGQIVGHEKDGIYYSSRKGSKHILKIMDAFGIDWAIVEKMTAKNIRIRDEETNEVYAISTEDFMAHGVLRNFGDGQQLFTSRKFFTKEQPKQHAPTQHPDSVPDRVQTSS